MKNIVKKGIGLFLALALGLGMVGISGYMTAKAEGGAPESPVVKSVKNISGRTVKVTLSQMAENVEGYQVQYSLQSNFKSAQTKKFASVSVELKNLQKKKYYIRVRAYNKQGGRTVYGAWSSTKTVKVASGIRFRTSKYSLKLPASWKGCYKTEIFHDGDFYVTAFYEKLCNQEVPDSGWLFSIAEYRDDSYDEQPSYEVLGSRNGVTYVAVFPTDVQFEGASAKAQRQYQKLAGTVEMVLKTFKIK